MGDLSKNFSRREFKCKCGNCKQVGPAPALVETLQALRDHTGRAIAINSGHRCEKYNRRVGGAKLSQHIKGTASDITVDGMSPNQVQELVDRLFPSIGGRGRYNTFTHIDVRSGRARWDNRT